MFETLASLTGIAGRGLVVDVAACLYRKDHWLGPHTDRPHRIATQVIYLNEEWNLEDGGQLRLLHSDRIEDIGAEVAPQLNTSVVIRRSERSWHAVMPVRDSIQCRRKSLLLHLSTRGSTCSPQ